MPMWTSQEAFNEEVLRIHNQLRNQHDSYALKLSAQLVAIAQSWADKLSESSDLYHSHSKYKGVRLGENVAMKCTATRQQYTPKEICDQWYSEVKLHDFDNEPTVLNSGHFTQMVWRNTTGMGVGRAMSKNGSSIVVVNYFPPGNVIGEFKSNVRAKISG